MSAGTDTILPVGELSNFARARRRFLGNPAAVIGIVIVISVVLAAAPCALHRALPQSCRLLRRFPSPTLAPSLAHLMGTDNVGRDILSRVLFGYRVSLLLVVGVLGVAVPLGVLFGLLAGYFGGDRRDRDHVADERHARRAAAGHGARHHGRAHARPDPLDDRHHRAVVDLALPPRLSGGEERRRRGFRRGRARRRRLASSHPVPRDPAQLRGGDLGQDDARCGLRHPVRRVAQLPRPRRPAADARSRHDGRGRRAVPAGDVVGGGDARPRRALRHPGISTCWATGCATCWMSRSDGHARPPPRDRGTSSIGFASYGHHDAGAERHPPARRGGPARRRHRRIRIGQVGHHEGGDRHPASSGRTHSGRQHPLRRAGTAGRSTGASASASRAPTSRSCTRIR